MRNIGRVLLLLSSTAAAGAVLASSPDVGGDEMATPMVDQSIVDFVEANCSDCHNDFQSEGDRSFDGFLADPNNKEYSHLLVEMLDEINRGAMPKKRDDVALPTDEERRAAVAAMTKYLTAMAELEVPEETPLRRLTNAEYSNTMRDLLGIEPDYASETTRFTADNNVEGLVNMARAQTLSQQQMQSYVVAAQQYLDVAFKQVTAPLPQATRTIFRPASMMRRPGDIELTRQTWAKLAKDGSYLELGHGRVDGSRPNFPNDYIATGGVPASGIYAIRIEAEGINHDTPHQDPQVAKDSGPMKLAVGFTPDPAKTDVVTASERPILEVFDVPDNKRKTYEVRTTLQKGSVPMFFWANGPRGSDYIADIIKDYYPNLLKYVGERKTFRYEKGGKVPAELAAFLRDEFKGPRVRVYSMEIIGPFASQRERAVTAADIKRYLDTPAGKLDGAFADFATKAFRRPVGKSEIAPYLALTQAKLKEGVKKDEALKLGFAAVLASPRFLFLDEGNADTSRDLDGYQLANRLSYFLWSSMPDATLLKLAASGEIKQPDVMAAQVRRMLRDERASAFVGGFTNAWLRLDKLGSMPPDEKVRPAYFNDRLEPAMRKETELVFAEVLFGNKPVREFLDGDFTYVNGGLAKLYKIDGIDGEAFQRVTIPASEDRRGLIGHASILTASANGIDTSPVLRGVWVLENLLGTPPPPPPPDVPAIEPDQRGATSVKELIAKHRSVTACADCHANIDPYGFPLEIFGPIGERRQRYSINLDGKVQLNRGKPIEADTQLPDGKKVATLMDFTAHLVDRKADFQRHLVAKLMSYGSGRETVFRDRAEIQQIVDDIDASGGGFEDMIVKVATSRHFKSR